MTARTPWLDGQTNTPKTPCDVASIARDLARVGDYLDELSGFLLSLGDKSNDSKTVNLDLFAGEIHRIVDELRLQRHCKEVAQCCD